jgi:ABC-2 type transport system permease protein
MRGFVAVLRKEALHMMRDRGTLRLALLIPTFQLILFGLIDTNVEHVPTVVFDQSHTRESRELIQDFVNTSVFDIVGAEQSRDGLRHAIVAGRASVGIEIPPDFARRRLYGEPADFLVLIDGSDNSVASQTLLAATGLALQRSVLELLAASGAARGSAADGTSGASRGGEGSLQPALRPHPILLFNPDARSALLLIPGLMGILLMFSGTVLASFAIVRERERGTLEQLMVTPVSPFGVVMGKLIPYLVLSFIQLLVIIFLMTVFFQVPVHGNVFLLLGLSVIYLFSLLSVGLLVSSVAKTQIEASQIVQTVLLPSIMLSGYIFPLSSLPGPLRAFAQLLPATHYIAISRAIIIRGASFADLTGHVVALLVIGAILVAGSTRAFRKTIS